MRLYIFILFSGSAKFSKATYLLKGFSVLSKPSPLTSLLDFYMVFGGVCSGAGLWKHSSENHIKIQLSS